MRYASISLETLHNDRPRLRGHVAEPEAWHGWVDAECLICHSHQCGRCDRCRLSAGSGRDCSKGKQVAELADQLKELNAQAALQEKELQDLLQDSDPYVQELRDEYRYQLGQREASWKLAGRALGGYEARIMQAHHTPVGTAEWIKIKDRRWVGGEAPPGVPSHG